MRTCFVHIGMHKTGSTAIQTAFHGYDDGKTVFLRTGKPNHSSPMLLLFSAHPDRAAKRLGIRVGKLDDHARRLRKRIVSQFEGNQSNFVISGEGLSSDLSTTEIEQLKLFLGTWFEEIRIIVYLRDPASYMRSAFQQTVKSKYVAVDLAPFWPQYRMRIGGWTDTFGSANVDAVLFDRHNFKGRSVIQDFAHRIGADVARTNVPYDNLSLRAEAFALAYTMHAEMASGRLAFGQWVRQRADVYMTRRYGQQDFDFADELYDAELVRHSDDVAWAEQLMQCSFPLRSVSTDAVVFGNQDDICRYAASCRAAFEDWKRKQFRTGQRLGFLAGALRRRLKGYGITNAE